MSDETPTENPSSSAAPQSEGMSTDNDLYIASYRQAVALYDSCVRHASALPSQRRRLASSKRSEPSSGATAIVGSFSRALSHPARPLLVASNRGKAP